MCTQKNIFILVLFYACSSCVWAQSTPEFLLKKNSVSAIAITTSGWGVAHSRSLQKTAATNRTLELGLYAIHHPKEIKTFASYSSQNRSYIFGKQYSFYALEMGLGYQKLVFEKDKDKGVSLHRYLSAGMSLGLLQPVYLKVATPTDQQPLLTQTVLYDPNSHFPDKIAGRADIGTGLNQMRPKPGIYAKAGLLFDASSEYERILAFDLGLKLSYYPQPIAMMAFNKPQNLWVTAYFSVGIGRRY